MAIMTISEVKQKAVIKIYFSIEFVKNKMATSLIVSLKYLIGITSTKTLNMILSYLLKCVILLPRSQ